MIKDKRRERKLTVVIW